MSEDPAPRYRKDYAPLPYRITSINLSVQVFAEFADVESTLIISRCAEIDSAPLVLDGGGLSLREISVDGMPLKDSAYAVSEQTLTVHEPPAEFALRTVVRIDPYRNLALEGFYASGDMLCSQCEAEGFRRITYFYDRPDAMTVFTTRLEADRKTYPILLSNGNKVAAGELPDNRHFVTWHDPFQKPCYLFAIVAGDLALVEDEFRTASGRDVDLHLYVNHGNENRCAHAMASLKHAMHWDEEVYGREYDLDLFMIVAVDAFNFGAMENKGLNIFNSSCVLARAETATDADFDRIEGVVAHEYFHNWTGNRVTCRDWFQLTLKEGLTVFRDQEFSADMGSRTDKRISDVIDLRHAQLPEDAGPNAHPIRPDFYIDINNFYTPTVYEKGAEVIRMIHTLIGPDAFRKGTDLYFERHDGGAVTCEDFVAAMEAASGADLGKFRNWYRFGGTPTVSVSTAYDAENCEVRITAEQTCRQLPGYEGPAAFVVPIRIGLLGRDGQEVGDERLVVLTEKAQTFTFSDVTEPVVPSLLRDYSAPVILSYEYSQDELLLLLKADTNLFNRFEAAQRALHAELAVILAGGAPSEALMRAMISVLTADDCMFAARTLTLPGVTEIIAPFPIADHVTAWHAREAWYDAFAKFAECELRTAYGALSKPAAVPGRDGASARALRNVTLSLLARLPGGPRLALAQMRRATCMTDEFAALMCLARGNSAETTEGLQVFLERWKDEPLVMNKWFAVQGGSATLGQPEHITALAAHPQFDAGNPNKLRGLYGSFSANAPCFHAADGSGYQLIADAVITVAGYNSSVASRIALAFKDLARLPEHRQKLARTELKRIVGSAGLPADVYEIVSRTLGRN